MKSANLLLVMLFSIAVMACGGGGGGTSGDSVTGTAAQYFTKTAVGNTWEWSGTATFLGVAPPYINPTESETATITASSGGIVTISAYDPNGGYPYYAAYPTGYPTYTMQINQSGEWTVTGRNGTYALLPATFSVGTTWAFPAGAVTKGPLTFTVAGFGVTRTVPAGTFTDCLKLDWVHSDPLNPAITIASGSFYFSPTAGSLVDATADFAYVWNIAAVGSINFQLQSYVAN